jgi:hypothetical protein
VETKLALRGHTLRTVAGRLDAATARAIIRLWLDNAVLPLAEANRRIGEVVCAAFDPAGELVGVNSAYLALSDDDNLYWFYRTFIRSDRRGVFGLGRTMLRQAIAHLHAHPQGAAGVMLVTENPKLMMKGAGELLRKIGFTPAGKDARGCDVWRMRFKP